MARDNSLSHRAVQRLSERVTLLPLLIPQRVIKIEFNGNFSEERERDDEDEAMKMRTQNISLIDIRVFILRASTTVKSYRAAFHALSPDDDLSLSLTALI